MHFFTDFRKFLLSTCIFLCISAGDEFRVLAEGNHLSHRNQTAELIVTGTIVSTENNEPIPGVNILVKGTKSGASSKADGSFSIKVPNEKSVLIFSSIGYITQEIVVGNQKNLKVALSADTKSLEEVVVVGYGEVKRNNLTGATASIGAKDIEDRPVARLENALAGQLPGVDVRTTSGEPGSDIQIRIRGTGSINSSNDPLYVVDGVPVDDIKGLNPGDIKTLDVLKDAASAAIYGSRGSNGVVLITTKRGGQGKLSIQFNASKSLSRVEGRLNMMNPQQWIEFRKADIDKKWVDKGKTDKKDYKASDSQEFRAAELKITGPISSANANATYMYDPRWAYGTDSLDYVDWNDAFFGNTGSLDNYQITLSGGKDNTNYSVSGSYLTQKGIVVNTGYDRATLRANFDSKVNRVLKFGMTLAPSIEWRTGSGQTDGKDRAGMQAIGEPPISDKGVGAYAGLGGLPTYKWSGRYASPIGYLEKVIANRTRNKLNANVYLDFNLSNNLVFKIVGGADIYSNIDDTWVPSTALRADLAGTAYSDRSQGSTYHYLGQGTLNYNKKIGKEHDLSVLLGYAVETTKFNSSQQRANNFPNDWSNLFDISVATTTINTIYSGKNALISYFGRVQYDFKDKYLLSASIRRDGSSKFGNTNQWGIFPAAAAAWKVSRENFMKNVNFISDLKLRASYGVSGNNRIPDNAQFALLGNYNYNLGGAAAVIKGYAPTSFENSYLGWETNKSYNLGLDFGILSNSIQASVDYYSRTTSDLLLNAPVSSLTGFTNSWQNVGDILNRGLELSLSTQKRIGKFRWNTTVNVSYNTNEVLKLGNDNTPIPTGFSGLTSIIQVGQPIGSFKLYDVIGVYKDQADVDSSPHMAKTLPGDSKYRDVNNDGKIDDNDRTIVGNPQAPFYYGLKTDVTYQNFNLSILMNAQTGGKIYSMIGRSIDRSTSESLYNRLATWTDRWQSPEQPGNGIIPGNYATTGSYYDTRWLYSSDYLRVKNITLSYMVPPMKWFSYARVYVSVENPFIWHKYTGGYTPEAQSPVATDGGDYGGYPQSKTYSLGVNLTF